MTQGQIPFAAREREVIAIADGATWLRHVLSLTEQRSLVERCRAIMDGPAGGYVPTVRGGGKMRVRMVCLGRHWNALTYKYEPTRADYDDAPVARRELRKRGEAGQSSLSVRQSQVLVPTSIPPLRP